MQLKCKTSVTNGSEEAQKQGRGKANEKVSSERPTMKIKVKSTKHLSPVSATRDEFYVFPGLAKPLNRTPQGHS